jgi:hypothetical protein
MMTPAFVAPAPILRAHRRQTAGLALQKRSLLQIACSTPPASPPPSLPPPQPEVPKLAPGAKFGALRTAIGLRRSANRVQATIRTAQTQYRDADDESRRLASSAHGAVLGEDLSATPLGARSSVQDLAVPPAPPVVELKPARVVELLCAHVVRVQPDAADDVRRTLPELLNSVQLSMLALADAAAPLFYEEQSETEQMVDRSLAGDASAERVNAMMTLLELARFGTQHPAQLSPPSLDALPVKAELDSCLDCSTFRASNVDRPLLFGRSSPDDGGDNDSATPSLPIYFPNLLLAFRGISLSRQSGLCLPAKVRAIEELYLGWLRNPLTAARKIATAVFPGLRLDGTETSVHDSAAPGRKVRRVYPKTGLGARKALVGILLPIFTQEPTHRLVACAYREFTPNKQTDFIFKLRGARQTVDSAISSARRSLRAAMRMPGFHECQGSDSCSEKETEAAPIKQQTPGTFKKFRLEIFADVKWGNIHHFLPPLAIKVAPNIRDLLRVDVLTLIGLTSCLLTAFRDTHSPQLALSILYTAGVYLVKIVSGLQSALSNTRGQLSLEKGTSLVAADEGALAMLATLAAEQQFAFAAAVYVSQVTDNLESVEENIYSVQIDSQFEKAHEANAVEWKLRLSKWGFLDAHGLPLRIQRSSKPARSWDV